MVFSSLLFVFFFLPIVLLLYFIAKEKFRNYILLIASLLFYLYGEPQFIIVMIVCIIINYGLARGIEKYKTRFISKVFFFGAILFDLSILFIYKYFTFSIHLWNRLFGTNISLINIALPIGISFFIFQTLSYIIDVYRGTVRAQRNIANLALYISFFPQLIAGPIVRYASIEKQIDDRKSNIDEFGKGGMRFLLGFSKKVILANNLAIVAADVFNNVESITTTNPILLWLGAICYSLQIFFDFSGYSDMAIGLAQIFGFCLGENFKYPYIAKSITEFWRRWHISLGEWFRDYVYIPLGGSRVTVCRHIINLLIVWLLTGIWHGANLTFVVWGGTYFILLVIEKYIVKPEYRKNKIFIAFWQLFTLICVIFGWVMFNSSSVTSGIRYWLAMVGYYRVKAEFDPLIFYYVREYGVFILAGIICSTPIVKKLGEVIRRSSIGGIVEVVAIPICYGLCFLWAVSYLILGMHNPFIYFNF